MALPVWTNQQILDQLVSGAKWSGPTITFAFPTSASGIYTGGGEGGGFRAFDAAQKSAAKLALTLWDDLVAGDFQEVAPGTSPTAANIEFAMSSTGVGYAHAYFPTLGSVWFNSAYGATSGGNNLVAPKVGQHGFLTYIHEIGHALGLDHMGDYNGSQTSGPSSFQDSTVYSVMSYYGPSWGSGSGNGEGLVAWADWVGADGRLYSPQTPMLNDILAIQSIYGVETTTRTGDTVYGFHTTITGDLAAVYDFSLNKNPILTLFDSGGIDTLDLSGWSTASIIDLAPGAFSSCNSMTNNIAIAYGCDIENAVGGAGADRISGNALGNELIGGAGNDQLFGLDGSDRLNGGDGNDVIDGGAGIDFVVFDALWDAVSLVYDSTTMTFTLAGTAIGTDTIVNVEFFTDAASVTRSAADWTGAGGAVLVSIAAVTGPVAEGNGGAGEPQVYQFRIALGAADSAVQSVAWSLAPGSGPGFAGAGDFVGPVSGVVTFAPGETEAFVTLQIAGDTLAEADEAFSVVLSSPSAGLVIAGGSAGGTILNDDVAPIQGTNGANTLNGTALDDLIYGLGGNDTLYGQAGDDLLDGGAGADRMSGGTGDDIYIVDSSKDRVTESAGAGNDTVRTTLAKFTLGANVENLEFAGPATAAFRGTGNSLANTITGGDGNDTLNGGAGSDTLWGLAGNDNFDFTSAPGATNVDTIMDFNTADDTIRLDNAVFKALGKKTGALAAGAFTIGTAAADSNDRIIYDDTTGALFYDPDGTGAGAAIRFAVLDLAGLTGTPTASDFVII